MGLESEGPLLKTLCKTGRDGLDFSTFFLFAFRGKAKPMKKEKTNEQLPASSVVDFDPIAGEYDKWYETTEGRQYDLLEKRVLRRLIGKVESGTHLLEVGAGTGWWSRFFSNLGYRVTGVDVSARMVEAARLKNIPDAQFEMADGHNLPFPDHHFSAAAAVTTIEFTRDPETVIREMVRCLKPDGRLFLGVLNGEAPLNKERKLKEDGLFAPARFLTAHEISRLLAPYGKPALKQCAFPLSIKMPTSMAGQADDFQAWLNMTSGAFIAVRMDL